MHFAITINKSQDQSLKTIGVDLQTSTFTYNQLYIISSQVISAQRVTILLFENGDGKKNSIVYLMVLL